jgi:hypothetical protein
MDTSAFDLELSFVGIPVSNSGFHVAFVPTEIFRVVSLSLADCHFAVITSWLAVGVEIAI